MKNEPNLKKQSDSRSAKHLPEKASKPAPGQTLSAADTTSDRLRMLAADRLRHFETLR